MRIYIVLFLFIFPKFQTNKIYYKKIDLIRILTHRVKVKFKELIIILIAIDISIENTEQVDIKL